MAKTALAMSDEDIMNLSPEEFAALETQEDDSTDEEENIPDGSEEGEQDEQNLENEEEQTESDESTDEESDEEEESSEKTKDNLGSKEEEKSTDGDGSGDDKKPVEQPEKPSDAIDYRAAYERLIETPIKADGKDIKLKSVDEAIQLIQMGVNYNKKMAELKPHRKLLKTLENNQLLNENDINFLVDLKNKKPEAIAKLLADAEINPLDIDVDVSKDYVPSSHSVSDQELNLDEIISELSSSKYYSRVATVVGKQWDEQSKKTIYGEPEILRTLHGHMIPDDKGNTLYDYVSSEVERRRILNQIPKNMSDYDAYISVGNDLYEQAQKQQAQANVAKRVVKPATKPNNVDTETLKNKKMAAAPTKGKAAPSKSNSLNPLAMSDEEFEKFSADKY